MVTADKVHHEHVDTTVCPVCHWDGSTLIAVLHVGLARECANRYCKTVFKYVLD